MAVIIEEIEKKPADCSVCDLCIRDEEGKHYCAVNADWVYPYGESVNLDCPVKNYEKPEWIPVSERLPEEHGRYLVYSRTVPPWKQHILNYDPDFNWWFWDGMKSDGCELEIDAWMPLPRPYEEDE